MERKAKSKTLATTNVYLKNAKVGAKMRIRSVASSTAIETRESVAAVEKKLKHPRSAARRAKLA